MWPPEIGRRRVLTDLHNAAADGAGAREVLKQRVAVAAADGAGQLRQVFTKGAEHFQHRILVGEEHVTPHRRIGGGDAGEIAETPAENLSTSERVTSASSSAVPTIV